MDSVSFVFALLKIALILGFLVTLTAVLTWVERRQCALIQDRVGPNRAVVYVPGLALKLLSGGGGLGLGAALAAAGMALREHPKAMVVCFAAAAVVALAGVVGAVRVPSGTVGIRLAGMLHPVADGIKFITKEDFVPPNGDRLLHALGPIIALFPALVTLAVVPFGDTLAVQLGAGGNLWSRLAHGRIGWADSLRHYHAAVPRFGMPTLSPDLLPVPLQIVDLDVGILYIFALAGTGIIGAAVAGWSSDNKYALLGGLRAASQMVSYEVAMGLSLVGAFMISSSLRLDDIVRWQSEHTWGIFVQPFAFVLFLAPAVAEQKRTPFDAPEGESEIVAGYFLEYSGMKFSMFMMGEYMELIVSSALLVTIFLGGYTIPFVHRDGITLAFGDRVLWQAALPHVALVALSVLVFFGKLLAVCFLQLFIRWTVPRFRYDQVMRLGWRRLLPAALVNMMLTGAALIAVDHASAGVDQALRIAADVCNAVVVLGFAYGGVAFVRFLASRPKPQQELLSTSAQRAHAQGGAHTSPMQA